MALKLRLARGGRKGRPFHKIVVADSRKPRDGRFIEKIGTYNPLLANDNPNRIMVSEERVKYWLGQGAKPSERVAKMLFQLGLGPKPEIRETPKKSAPKEKARMRAEDKAEKLKAKEEAEKAAAEEAASADAAPAEAEAQSEAEGPAENADAAPAEETKEDASAEESKDEAKDAEKPEEAASEDEGEKKE